MSAKGALEAAGFVYQRLSGIDMFLDSPDARARDAVHIVPAGEKIRPDYLATSPDVADSEKPDRFRVVTLHSLVTMKLTSFQLKDKVHLRDMLDVGPLDTSRVERFPPALGARLQQLIDSPEG
jgi:hypothetical protein